MYFVIHSTVTKVKFCRLYSINSIKKRKTMRTLNTNQLSSTLPNSKSYSWNSKRRYR